MITTEELNSWLDANDPTGELRKGAAKSVAPSVSTAIDPSDLPPLHKRIARAAKYLPRLSPSVQGQNGSRDLFTAARVLVHGFCLDQHTAMGLLLSEFNPRCEPPWSEKEIAHKLADAESKPFNKPRGWLLAKKPVAPTLTTATLPTVAREPQPQAKTEEKAELATLPRLHDEQANVEKKDKYLDLNEADDDPHRLARSVLEAYLSRGRRTLQFWNGEFHSWDGVSYRSHEDVVFRARVHRLVHRQMMSDHRARIKSFTPDQGERLPTMPKITESLISNVIGSLRSLCLLDDVEQSPCWINDVTGPKIVDLVAASNGIVRLPLYASKQENAIIDNTPDYFNFNAVKFDARHDSPDCKHWIEFLSTVWPDDSDAIKLLQEWFGYLLTPDNRKQKMLLLVGPSRSGKGTITRVLQELVGLANCANPTLGTMSGDFGLESLIGKSVAVIEDARLSNKSDISVITERLLTVSGGGRLDVNRKQKQHATVMLNTRFVVCTNEIPSLTDASAALARRWCVLQMTQSFLGREDDALAERLLQELPGIFNWAVAGWSRLMSQGKFTAPSSSFDAIEELTTASSPVSEFVSERCNVGERYSIQRHELFDMWKAWCERSGIREHGTLSMFTRRLKAYAHTIKTDRAKTRLREWCYFGIGAKGNHFLDDDSEDSPPSSDDSTGESTPTSADFRRLL